MLNSLRMIGRRIYDLVGIGDREDFDDTIKKNIINSRYSRKYLNQKSIFNSITKIIKGFLRNIG